MKCTAKIIIPEHSEPSPVRFGQLDYYGESTKECSGEMIEIGATSVVGQVTTKLYQCESCKTIKLV